MVQSALKTPPVAQGKTELQAAVLRTLAYSDVFDYPLTVGEVQQFLIGEKAEVSQVEQALDQLGERLARQGDLIALSGREALFAVRERRNRLASQLWPRARWFGRRIGGLPFVRMVAVTGALASDNVEEGADLDYFIVTRPGYLWVTRAMILALDRPAGWFGRARLCPNFIVSEDKLALDERDMFAAQELARMVPLSGWDVYRRMRAENVWSGQYLPNASGTPQDANIDRASALKRLGEAMLVNGATRRIEAWEMKRKIAKFSQGELNAETRFSADLCKGHFDGHKQRTMTAYASRLRELGLDA
jgi:hypothetical protein